MMAAGCLPPLPRCSAVEQLIEVSQTRALADALLSVKRLLAGPWRGGRQLGAVLDSLEAEMDREVRTLEVVGGRLSLEQYRMLGIRLHSLLLSSTACGGWRLAKAGRHAWAGGEGCAALLWVQGVDALAGRQKPGNLARPRRFELAAALNRLRTAQLRQQ